MAVQVNFRTGSPSPAPPSSSSSSSLPYPESDYQTANRIDAMSASRNRTADDASSSATPTIPSSSSNHQQWVPSPHDPSYFYTNSGPIPFHPSITPATSPGVPVFEPTIKIFSNFEAYCNGIDSWGMSTGIIKIVPPKDWLNSLPSLNSDLAESTNSSVKQVIIRNAITQHFTPAGSGVWRQTNVTRSRLWNLKQWADLCQDKDQRGPEMRRIKNKLQDSVSELVDNEQINGNSNNDQQVEGKKDSEDGVRTRSGRSKAKLPPPPPSSRTKRKRAALEREEKEKKEREMSEVSEIQENQLSAAPATPLSEEKIQEQTNPSSDDMPALEDDMHHDFVLGIREQHSRPASPSPSNSNSSNHAATPSTTSNANLSSAPAINSSSPSKKRKPRLTGRALTDSTTAEEWEAFNHETCWLNEALEDLPRSKSKSKSSPQSASDSTAIVPKASDWTPPYCKEVEGEYWRGLNFGKPPMYGADLKGTLFTDETRNWNVGKLDNLLTRLKMRKKLPGVTTPYLYLGMWRATFAWHVEDMDLYSINYIHFGAPKQWYSIRQADRGRFESALRGSFPQDSSRCPHFMRHKSYLVSPSYLHNHGIEPLHLVHHAQEFVITYPFGYHSGYNLGFNCAESVNFALDSWVDIGRKAGFCKCSEESVHMDIDAIIEESQKIEAEERVKEAEKAARENARLKVKERERLEKIRLQNLEKQKKMKANQFQLPIYDGAPAKKLKLSINDHQQHAGYNQKYQYAGQPYSQSSANGYGYPYGYSQNFFQPQSALASLKSLPNIPLKPSKAQPKIPQISCCLCPSEVPEDLVKIKGEHDPPLFAHRLCASFIPETWVGRKGEEENADIQGKPEEVKGYEGIDKARWNLKCGLCTDATHARKGAKIQCTSGSCPRAAHVSCVLGLEAMLDSNQRKDQKEESDALREESGWFLDVLGPNDADRLEGKGKYKPGRGKGKRKGKQPSSSARPSEAPSSDPVGQTGLASTAAGDQKELDSIVEEEGEDRLVILCRTHNPLLKQLEESRKNDAIRTLVLSLPIGQNINVKYGVGYSASVILCEVQDRAEGAAGVGEGTISVKDLNPRKGADPSAPPLDPAQVATNVMKWRNIIWSEDQEKELIRLKDGGAEEKRLQAQLEAEERLKKRKAMQKTAEEESLDEEKAFKMRGIVMRQEKAEKKRMEEMHQMALQNGNRNCNFGQMHSQHISNQQSYSPSQGHPQHYPQLHSPQQLQAAAHSHLQYQQPHFRSDSHLQSYSPNAGIQSHPQPQHQQYHHTQQAPASSQMHYQPSHFHTAPRPTSSMSIASFPHQQPVPKSATTYSNPDSFRNLSKPNPFLPSPIQSQFQAAHPPNLQHQQSYYAHQQHPQSTRDWQQNNHHPYALGQRGPSVQGNPLANPIANGASPSISHANFEARVPQPHSQIPSASYYHQQHQSHMKEQPLATLGSLDTLHSEHQRQLANSPMRHHGTLTTNHSHYDPVRSLSHSNRSSMSASPHPPVTSGSYLSDR